MKKIIGSILLVLAGKSIFFNERILLGEKIAFWVGWIFLIISLFLLWDRKKKNN